MTDAPQHYDALLVLSFGGPEGEDEVIPFLENVTQGRGIPRERLRVVGEHYFHFGGVSPLNRLNRELIANVEAELSRRGETLPVYFGNRNWHPFAQEAAEQMAADGVRRVLVFATSAWAGYSGTDQYNEDIIRMRDHLASKGLPDIEFTKLRQFYDHPRVIAESAASVRRAREEAPKDARVIFTAHSVPLAADNAAGGPEDPQLYSRQVKEAARLIATSAGVEQWDVVWQSRSGNPRTPWLEPDVVDHVVDLHDKQGVNAIVVFPVGFISDHMEVVWDLDTELREAVDERGMTMVRASTIGSTPEFAGMVVDLIDEWTKDAPLESAGEVTVTGASINGEPCSDPQRSRYRPVATA
ncbi:ferrochelatase [Corynebacterium uberis]|uniref:ferrochelatase n=1 Tax=Corynebacterium TaxID=1716 RepID=UPI001D0BDCAB|nr:MULTISPECIES: ferrochelatase [Corynebacterium]MCZ9308634.1 ferrochelatase [Corynebacterium sp. c6VSa_13]UDL74276.1 ferrochelatase [Corynebacterium uberis]UDL74844.1 ferrochelatase [Corynebacterium uberis]UDL77058.1 ferrochelatase [Corynebacterium uberis]UDL81471.1 ferrochelatase [Corynebacterium uberis]